MRIFVKEYELAMEFFKDARGKTVMDLSCGSGVRMLNVCVPMLSFFVCVCSNSCVCPLFLCVCPLCVCVCLCAVAHGCVCVSQGVCMRSVAPGGAPPRLLTPRTCFANFVCFPKKKN